MVMEKIFFNHIPKTAGTTFYEYISRYYKESEISPRSSLGGYESIAKFEKEEVGENMSFIFSHKNIRDYLDDSWNIISFLREPKDRLFSLYNHWQSWTDEEIDKSPTTQEIKDLKKKIKNMRLVDVLDLDHSLIQFHFVNGMSKSLIPINKHKLINNPKKLLKEAKKQLDKMSFFGIVERFKESQLLFEYLYKLPHEKDLQPLNYREYKMDFTKEEEAKIYDSIKIDLEIYDYALSKFDQALKDVIVKEINSRAVSNSDKKIFFLHLMKTAGTSLIKTLSEHFDVTDIVPLRFQLIINSRFTNLNDDLKKDLENLRNNYLYKEKIKEIESSMPEKASLKDLDFKNIFNRFKFLADHTTYQKILPPEWSVVTILRNPKRRLLSHINDLKNLSENTISSIPETANNKRDVMFNLKSMSIDEILSLEDISLKQILINNQTKFTAGFFGDANFSNKSDKEILEEALSNINKFLAVGITEKMFESVALIHYKMQLPFSGDIPTENSGGKYSEEVINEDLLEKATCLDNVLYSEANKIFHQQYFEMLEDFVNSNAKDVSVGGNKEFLMSDNFVGTGWHQREGFDLGNIYRWSGPARISTIKLNFFCYQIKGVVISVISAMHSDLIKKTKLFINDNELIVSVEDVGNGHFLISADVEIKDDDLAILKFEVPFVVSHADIGVDKKDFRKKGIAIDKIKLDLSDFKYHGRPVLLCHSLGDECGISTYTKMLSESQNIAVVKRLEDLQLEIPSHIHLQHEFGIVSIKQLEQIIDFCKRNDVKLYVTMHTVLPKIINIYSFLLFKFKFALKYNLTLELLKKFDFRHMFIFNKNKKDVWRPSSVVESWNFIKNQYLVIKNSDRIFAHSESAKKELIQQGAKEVQLFIHPTISFPVSDTLYSNDNGEIHIGFFGFFNRDKNILDLIKIVKNIQKCNLHIFSCVKKDHDHDYYNLLKKEIDGSSRIIWHEDFIPLEEVIFELSKCDFLVWNSKPIAHYSSSGSIRQYLAAKRPILARRNNLVEDLEGIIEIVDEITTESVSNFIDKRIFASDKIDDYIEKYSWRNSIINYD